MEEHFLFDFSGLLECPFHFLERGSCFFKDVTGFPMDKWNGHDNTLVLVLIAIHIIWNGRLQ